MDGQTSHSANRHYRPEETAMPTPTPTDDRASLGELLRLGALKTVLDLTKEI